MKTAYINEPGVKPWESIHPTSDAKFNTTTLLDRDFTSVWKAWCDVADQLSESWPIRREWMSIGGADFNSKSEKYIFEKSLTRSTKEGDICKKNEKSNIYSTIKHRPNDSKKIDNLALSGSHDVLLILQRQQTGAEELWVHMTIFEKDITPENISTFLNSVPQIVLCRFYDTETHATAQFVYSSMHESEIVSAIRACHLQQISEHDVYNYINRQHKHLDEKQ